MEIKITEFFNNANFADYSGSIAELGENAAKITWNNAINYAKKSPFLAANEDFAMFREHIKTFGAWDDEEIGDFTGIELNALLVQLIASDIREAEKEIPELMTAKNFDFGNIYASECHGDNVYYYIGE